MKRGIHLLLLLLCSIALGQTPASLPGQGPELGPMLNFEGDQPGPMPRGWGGTPAGISIDNQIVHGGRSSARIERTDTSDGVGSTLTKGLTIDFSGNVVEWRGFLRFENVTGFTGLWMREDGEAGSVAFDNMEKRQLSGTQDWAEYSITLPLRPEAKQLVIGVLLVGTGKVWADDLQLLVNGKPVWEAPKAIRPKTVIDSDHEFDGGSGITLTQLSKVQTDNLMMLGKVWGFLKYHHPAITTGQRHWDYDLFRVMPRVLAAETRAAANVVVQNWIQGLGPVPACVNCAAGSFPDTQLQPDLSWLNEERFVGQEVASLLRNIYRNRQRNSQFFVSQAQNVGNPIFEREPGYPNLRFPDAGYQLLGLFRYWNIIEYWSPNRNVIDQNWNDVLVEFLPRIGLARTKDQYQLETLALIARITDTHANLNLPAQLRPPGGMCQLPLNLRFIENQAVVTGFSSQTPPNGVRVGDVIERLDDRPVQELVDSLVPYFSASNQAVRLRDIARGLTRGPCAAVRVNGTISLDRVPLASLNQTGSATHDLPGDTFRLLSDEVAYLKLSSVKVADVRGYVERANGTKGLVIDIRNYPSEFVVFALGSLLVDRPTEFVRFTRLELSSPGTFRWDEHPPVLTPAAPRYSGKVVILVDEVSQSQAEYTAMAFRAAPGAVVVGSTTAGADGNISAIPLPGGLATNISGIGVFYPDKKPTQRVGIIPDIEAKPTIAGIRAGRDEVLEVGVRQILGPQAPADQIQRMTRP